MLRNLLWQLVQVVAKSLSIPVADSCGTFAIFCSFHKKKAKSNCIGLRLICMIYLRGALTWFIWPNDNDFDFLALGVAMIPGHKSK